VAKQTVTLRLEQEDLDYLSAVDIQGAGNFSEKIRALLAEARAQREGVNDPAAAHDFARRIFARVDREIHTAEIKAGIRSELMHRMLAWLPEVTAYMLATDGDDEKSSHRQRLGNIELGLMERVLSLVDSTQQMSRAGFRGCYDPDALMQRAAGRLESGPKDNNADADADAE